jgi:hypothetical protein
VGLICAICQGPFQGGAQVAPCPACAAPFHSECWDENGGCASYGCELLPEATAAPALPPSVWGQEERACPGCGGLIKMAARRCLHCGAGVAAAGEPPAAGRSPGAPGAVAAALLFAGALLPISAPVALLAGGLWLRARRRDLARWPSNVRLVMIAAVVAAGAVTLVTLIGLAVHLGGRPAIGD